MRLMTALLVLGTSAPLAAQTMEVRSITLDGAKRIMEAAEAEARKNSWNVTIAIVDQAGYPLMITRMENASPITVDVAIGKARTAALFKGATKGLQDAVAAGRVNLMAIPGIMPLEGGVPIVLEGRVVGAIGASGVTSAQDAQIASAGAAVVQR